MALTRLKTWVKEVLTFADLNAEFDRILNNALTLISPLTGTLNANGNRIDLDTNNDTSIRSSADDQIDFEVGGTDVLVITSTDVTFKGSSIVTTAEVRRMGLGTLVQRVSFAEHRINELSGNSTLESQVINF